MPFSRPRSMGAQRITIAVLLAGSVLLPAAEAAVEIPPRKVHITTITCEEFATVTGEERDRILIYMNGYVDGTRGTTTWDAAVVGKRIDEVIRLCQASPKSPLLGTFKRVWAR